MPRATQFARYGHLRKGLNLFRKYSVQNPEAIQRITKGSHPPARRVGRQIQLITQEAIQRITKGCHSVKNMRSAHNSGSESANYWGSHPLARRVSLQIQLITQEVIQRITERSHPLAHAKLHGNCRSLLVSHHDNAFFCFLYLRSHEI